MPASAENTTPDRLIQEVSTILDRLMAADWMAMGTPSATSLRSAFFSMAKLESLKSKPKLSLWWYR